MADANSSLPVRTQTNGDVAATMADGTTPSQLAKVDTHGSQYAVPTDSTGAVFSATNPLPVTFSEVPLGTLVNKYNTTSALAAAGTANHDYVITSGKTFSGKKFWASGSGKIKIDIRTSPDGAVFTTFWTGFNSTAAPNIDIDLGSLTIQDSGTSSTIRIVVKNMDILSQDVYSTISGVETP